MFTSFIASKFNELKEKADQLGLQDLATDLRSKAKGYLEKYLEEKDEANVEGFLDRIANEILTEDRKEGLVNLRGLLTSGSPVALATFGEKGFDVINALMRDERGDVSLLQLALETLRQGISARITGDASGPLPDVSKINAELYARGEGFIPLVLALLEEEPVGVSDPVVRYEALQILRRLASVSPARMEHAVLHSSTSIARVVELIVTERELVRSEAISLLTALSVNSDHIQNIVTYENAFDKLLNVYQEETSTGTYSNANAADVLDLMATLLRGNVKSQAMLRDLNFAPRLVSIMTDAYNALSASMPQSLSQELQTMALGGEGADTRAAAWAQQLATLYSLLGVFHVIFPRKGAVTQGKQVGFLDAERTENIRLLGSHLLGLALLLVFHPRLSPTVPPAHEHKLASAEVTTSQVRASGLALIASICDGHPEMRDVLAASLVTWFPPSSSPQLQSRPVGPEPLQLGALHAITRRCIFAETISESEAALEVLSKYCAENAEGQLLLCSTLSVPLEGSEFDADFYVHRTLVEPSAAMSLGAELVRAVIAATLVPEGEPARLAAVEAGYAAAVLSLFVQNSNACKERLLMLDLQLPAVLVGRLHDPTLTGAIVSALSRSNAATAQPDDAWDVCTSQLLAFLAVWAERNEPVASYILARPDCTLLLAEIIKSKGVSAGFASACIGLLLTSSPAPSRPDQLTPQSFLRFLSDNVGLGVVISSLQRFSASQSFKLAQARPPIFCPRQLANVAASQVDSEELDYFRIRSSSLTLQVKVGDVALRDLLPVVFGIENHAAGTDIAASVSTLEEARRLITELEMKNRVLLTNLSKGESASGGFNPETEVRMAQIEADLSSAQQEKSRLERSLRAMQDDLARSRQTEEDLRLVLDRTKEELNSVVSAYTELEAHAKLLESEAAQRPQAPAAEQPKEDGGQDADLEGELNDLLVCLGQEEAKVEKLRSHLEAMGVDVDALLENLGGESEAQ